MIDYTARYVLITLGIGFIAGIISTKYEVQKLGTRVQVFYVKKRMDSLCPAQVLPFFGGLSRLGKVTVF